MPPSAYAQSALALALAASGDDDEALAVAGEVNDSDRGTYLDRVMAQIAIGLIAARRGDDEALAILNDTIENVDALEDEVAQTIARLAEAAALAVLDVPSATRGRARGRRPPGRPGHRCARLAPGHRPRARPQAGFGLRPRTRTSGPGGPLV